MKHQRISYRIVNKQRYAIFLDKTQGYKYINFLTSFEVGQVDS